MPLILPFAGLRPAAGRAGDVAAPPYDVLNTEEAREQAKTRQWSFLHVSKPEIDLPPGTDPYGSSVYTKGKENFIRMINEGVLVQDKTNCLYIYRLKMGNHTQIGLVAVASVAAYDKNRIRKHEFTRPEKEDDRVRQIDTLNAQTGPVFLTYRHNEYVDSAVANIINTKPQIDITTADAVQHTIWVVRDVKTVQSLTMAFNDMDYLYIADGHHRSAAASRVSKIRSQTNSKQTDKENHNYFLSVIFPDNQTRILDYNRVVRDLNGLSPRKFLEHISKRFRIKASEGPLKPIAREQFGMYLDGNWYHLQINSDLVSVDNPVARLDVSLLSDNLLEPVLGITDLRRDKRINFVGGIRGMKELERLVDNGEMAVAFSMFPTGMDDLMTVADAGQVMPPKSTWFEPKLADGLVSHMLA